MEASPVGVNGATTKPADAKATQAQSDYTKNFLKNAEQKFLNLGTTDKEIFDMVVEAATGENSNQGLLMGLQQLIDKRTQMVGTITNLLKKASDTIQEIIRNLRN